MVRDLGLLEGTWDREVAGVSTVNEVQDAAGHPAMTSREKEPNTVTHSPLRKSLEAFEENIGQHSWLVANELREYLNWFSLSDQVLDFGCGPAGPLCARQRLQVLISMLQRSRLRKSGLPPWD